MSALAPINCNSRLRSTLRQPVRVRTLSALALISCSRRLRSTLRQPVPERRPSR
ncbi:hypothetical protein [Amycolatopsis sp. cg13]|uniref:hypothetical protein n=1 Tax=Amycolatopsis sp. cg13 TaxID=3238807 RepID=UPI0035239871